jgi:predicted dehydrogenase
VGEENTAGMKLRSDTNRAINVGIIGTGYGLTSLLPVLEFSPDYKVICFATKEGNNQKSTRDGPMSSEVFYVTPKELIQSVDIDLVLIASPPSTHEEYATAAIAEGKNVYCEKPVGLSLDSTRRIVLASNQTKKICTVGYQFRFDPMIRWLKNQILTDELGEIIRVGIRWETSGALKTPEASWRNNLNLGGGVLREFASHVFDYLSYMEAISCTPTNGEVDASHNFKSNITSRDIQNVNFSGAFGSVQFDCVISRTKTRPMGHLIRITGTKGEARAHHRPPFGLEQLTLEVHKDAGVNKHSILMDCESPETVGFPKNQLDSRQIASSQLFFNFAQAIKGVPCASLPSFEDALLSQKLVEEAESVLF